MRAPETLKQEKPISQKDRGVRARGIIASAPISQIPGVKRARKTAERFDPLKVLLGSIPAACANHQVRYNTTFKNSLYSCFAGSCRRREEDREPPLAYCHVGKPFRFASDRCGRTEAPGGPAAVRHRHPTRFGAETLPASLKTSKNNCGPWLKSLSCAPKKSTGPSRIYERQCLNTRFA